MKLKAKHGVFSNILFTIKSILRIDKLLFLSMIAMLVSSLVQPLIVIFMPKFIIQFFEENRPINHLLILIAIFGIISLINGLIKSFSDGYFPRKVAYYRSMKWGSEMALATLYVDYKYLSSEQGQLEIDKARRAANRATSGLQDIVLRIVECSTNLLGAIIYVMILSSLNPLIIIALISCGLISYLVGNQVNKYRLKHRDTMGKIEKKHEYVSDTTRDIKYAKDIRMYGMYDWLKNLGDNLLEDGNQWEKRISFRVFLSALVEGLIAFIRDGFAYLYLISLVLNHTIAVSEFVLYIASISGFSVWISNLVNNTITLNADSLQVSDFRIFIEKAENNKKNRLDKVTIEEPLSIELKDVCFSYGDHNIFKDFNLKIEAGKKLALVGINGAGKSTLVKLILNLIEPDSGQILLNDIPIKDIDLMQYYDQFSVAFQDALVIAYGIDVNISMKSSETTDQDKVDEVIKLAGLESKILSLKQGKYTSAEKYLDFDGTELSGGEKQKLILARALYKDAPFLILDEPSSALDPIAEADLYEKYHEMTENKTSIYISHRLSSTKFCDEVILLDQGQIIERGSHSELMKLKGKYAEMFEVQSHYYKEEIEVSS